MFILNKTKKIKKLTPCITVTTLFFKRKLLSLLYHLITTTKRNQFLFYYSKYFILKVFSFLSSSKYSKSHKIYKRHKLQKMEYPKTNIKKSQNFQKLNLCSITSHCVILITPGMQ